MDYEYDHVLPTYLAISRYCNIRCNYCYVPELNKDQQSGVDQRALDMMHTMIKKAKAERFALSHTTLHGAEPTTLSPKVIAELVEEFSTITTTSSINMQTNGVGLNKKYHERMGDLSKKLRIGFTIDFPQVLHDKNRQRTYKKVIENLIYTYDLGYACRVLIGVTAETLDHLEAFKTELRALLRRCPALRVGIKHIKGGDYEMSTDDKVKWADFLWKTGFYDFDHTLWGNLCQSRGNDCWWFEFGEDGAVNSCNKTNNPEGKFANWKEEPISDVITKRKALYKETPVSKDCEKCDYWTFCKGSCPVDRSEDGAVLDCVVRKRLFWHMQLNGKNPKSITEQTPQFVHIQKYAKWKRYGIKNGYIFPR